MLPINIYIDYPVREWQKLVNPGLKISRDCYLNVRLFEGDFRIIEHTQFAKQKSGPEIYHTR